MLPGGKDYQRVRRRIETGVAQPQGSADGTIEIFLHEAADLLGIIGSCWHHTDPSSGLPIASAMLGDPAGSLEESLTYEFERPDLNRFHELRRRRTRVAAISIETGGKLRDSARFREMIEPTGAADELRIAFADQFGLWSALVVFTDRAMTIADLQFVSHLLEPATGALRSSAATQARQPARKAPEDDGGPSVLILNRDDRIVAADATARRRLTIVPDPRQAELPGLISFVAAQARWGQVGRSDTARMRADGGRWFLVDASLLGEADNADGDVAVVIQPAPTPAIQDAVLRALGLSARERGVAALALQGHTAKAIASTLVISPWTAQDHLKAIYDKTGVRSRSELVTLVGGTTGPQ